VKVIHPARISRETFARVLRDADSPLAPQARAAYQLIREYGIDPAFALALYRKESSCGRQGVAVETRNFGNVREPYANEHATGTHPRGFAIFPDWMTGLLDWCQRIVYRYVEGWGLHTVEAIIPVYAPDSDGNNAQQYVNQVIAWVSAWQAEEREMQIHDVRDTYQGGYTEQRRSTDYVVVHHAAWTYQPGIAAVQAVHTYHLQQWGTGIAYHEALVEEADGSIACYITSAPDLLRYGVAYQNHRSFHISALTNFADTIPEQKWLDALAARVAAARARWPRAEVVGHKEITVPGWESSCPGTRWHEWKPLVLGGTVPELRAPHWYRVPSRSVAVVRYEPQVDGDRNVAALLSPRSRVHVAAWQGEWARLSMGGFVHITGLEAE
jgi:hypothetical protein